MRARQILKWTGVAIGAVLAIVILIVTFFNYKGSQRVSKHYDIKPIALTIPTDSASLQKGAHWVGALCSFCHGENLGGNLFNESPGFGTFYSSNLTPGKGGVGGRYTDEDWVRAIRHGVTPEGRALIGMPAADFNNLSASDVGAIIAYLKTLPPVDNEQPSSEMLIIGRVLLGGGQLDGIISAEVIDHTRPFPEAPSMEISTTFGKYLVDAIGCRTCHGKELNGMQPPMPGAPFAPNLTPGGNLVNWSPEIFIAAMRSGKTPEGKILDGKFMPVGLINKMTDEELKSIFQYLSSLPK